MFKDATTHHLVCGRGRDRLMANTNSFIVVVFIGMGLPNRNGCEICNKFVSENERGSQANSAQ